jgi:uncharacterized paraquat-inducible protein A
MPYLLILAAAIAGGVTGYILLRRQRDERQQGYHFRCPGCGQKLRFGKRDQGRRVMCPRCLKTCTLAEVKQDQLVEMPSEAAFQVKRRSSV